MQENHDSKMNTHWYVKYADMVCATKLNTYFMAKALRSQFSDGVLLVNSKVTYQCVHFTKKYVECQARKPDSVLTSSFYDTSHIFMTHCTMAIKLTCDNFSCSSPTCILPKAYIHNCANNMRAKEKSRK